MRLSLTEISLTAVVALSILLSGSSTTTALPTAPINRHPRNFLPPSKGLSPRSFPAPIDRRPHLQPRADAAQKSYDNHRVVRILLKTEEQLKQLTAVEHDLHLDYFSHNKILGGAIDVRVPPESFDKFKALGFSFEILINNLQDLLNVEQDEDNKYQQKWMAIKKTMVESFQEVGGSLLRKPGGSTPVPKADDWFAGYHSYDDHTTWLNAQIKNHSDIATGFSAGKTYEGREQAGIKIGKGPNNVVLHGLQHAREWISGAVVEYIIDQLVTGTDPKVAEYLKTFTFHIIPIMNPDGFVITQTKDRMHRKNTQPNPSNPECLGTDTNRNWDFHWNEGGSSSDVCADDYMGPKAFSSPEATNIGKYLKDTPNVVSYIDFHAYSQLWMVPYGYTGTVPENYDYLKRLADGAVAALKKVNGVSFKAGDIYNTIYQASGSSTDYAFNVGVKAPFAVELRDTGRYGFSLPASQIVPSGEETWEAFKSVLDNVLKP
ncbi:hypothetical protein KVV02_007155 [Mortierella alpina]|uniref:Carboxypeptidase M14A n=1 Tax=Mortierella alpina TaxID=64518 RepID=A0A9P8A2Z1_MORAP|nr:hypothetical protein KVV02_007155 [Mortierella alpina]